MKILLTDMMQIRKAGWEIQVLADDKSKLFESLKVELNLTDEQIVLLRLLSAEIEHEVFYLEIINKCFSALRTHEWLYFPGMEVVYLFQGLDERNFLPDIQTLFSNTKAALSFQQLHKLLRFTTENQETIRNLKVRTNIYSFLS